MVFKDCNVFVCVVFLILVREFGCKSLKVCYLIMIFGYSNVNICVDI